MMSENSNETLRTPLLAYLATFIIIFVISYLFLNQYLDSNKVKTINPSTPRLSDTEIALTFIGCSTCPAATDDRIPSLISKLSEKLRKKAISNGYAYTLIGTSNERNINKGLTYLKSIASFDEIAIGNGMGNTVLQYYVWETFDHSLSAATPQVIISKRTYDSMNINGRNVVHPNIISQKIIHREIGIKRIKTLLKNNGFLKSL